MVTIAASEHTGLWAPVFSEQDWLKWAEQLQSMLKVYQLLLCNLMLSSNTMACITFKRPDTETHDIASHITPVHNVTPVQNYFCSLFMSTELQKKAWKTSCTNNWLFLTSSNSITYTNTLFSLLRSYRNIRLFILHHSNQTLRPD